MDAAPVQHIEIVDGQAVIGVGKLKAKIIGQMAANSTMTVEEIMAEYGLKHAEVHAAITYYYDSFDTIEQGLREAEQYVRAVGYFSNDLKTKILSRKA